MKKLFISLLFSIDGLRYAFQNEKNFRIEIISALVVLCFGYMLQLSTFQWLIIVLNIGTVLSAELFNTAIERVCEKLEPGLNPIIKIIKDTAAASVMIASFCAAISGCVIFIPLIYKLIVQ